MNAVKLYFFIFLILIFVPRVALKWNDTDIVKPESQKPAIESVSNTNIQEKITDIEKKLSNDLAQSPIPPKPKLMRIPFAMYIIMVIIELVALIGIFGFAFKKQIFSSIFWKIFLIPFVLIEGYIIYTSTFQDIFLVFIYSLAIILPAPYTIYAYGFKYKWINNKPKTTEEE